MNYEYSCWDPSIELQCLWTSREVHKASAQNSPELYHRRETVVISVDSLHVIFVHTKNRDDFLRFERAPGSP